MVDRAEIGKTVRTNGVEVDAIVEDVMRRFRNSPGEVPSLGVIRFNAQQRDLIENQMRDSPDERPHRALHEQDGLFVKNMENIQGDERDTILFSVAFSANDKGVVPLGPT
jgi:superfamily I DNA and/or RNA helicase